MHSMYVSVHSNGFISDTIEYALWENIGEWKSFQVNWKKKTKRWG